MNRLRRMRAACIAALAFATAIEASELEVLNSIPADVHGTQLAASTTLTDQALSADGRFVVVANAAQNVTADDELTHTDVFLLDRASGDLARLSSTPSGRPAGGSSAAAAISDDGNRVLYVTNASDIAGNALGLMLWTRSQGTTRLDSPYYYHLPPSLSGNGRVVAYWSQGEPMRRRDLESGSDLEVAVGGAPVPTNGTDQPSLSNDGNRLVFIGMGDSASLERGVRLYDHASGSVIVVGRTLDGGTTRKNVSNARISGNGRFVAFVANPGSGLVEQDAGVAQVLVHDLDTGITRVASATADGTPGNAASTFPSISDDGRYIAFGSNATNLAPGPSGAITEYFRKDLETGAVTRLTIPLYAGTAGSSGRGAIDATGETALFLSGDARLVANDTTRFTDAFLWREGEPLVRPIVGAAVEVGGPSLFQPRFSPSGRFVAAESSGQSIIDRHTRERRDVSAFGATVRHIGADGNSLVVETITTTPIDFDPPPPPPPPGTCDDYDWLLDEVTMTPYSLVDFEPVPNGHPNGDCSILSPHLSPDGRYVAFQSQSSNLSTIPNVSKTSQVFLFDHTGDDLEMVSVSPEDIAGDASSTDAQVSADGRFVAFASRASNLVPGPHAGNAQIYLRDTAARSTRLVSATPSGLPGNSHSSRPRVSGDGRFVVFLSASTDLVANDGNTHTDAFVFDAVAGTVRRLAGGVVPDAATSAVEVSLGGRNVAFASAARNLIPGQFILHAQVYVEDLITGQLTIASSDVAGTPGHGTSGGASLTAEGDWVAFHSEAKNWNVAPRRLGSHHNIFAKRVAAPMMESGFE